MTKRLQRRATEPSQPILLRLVAFACLLLVTVASSAQVTHVHGQFLPHHAQQVGELPDASQLTGGEERCPLCVAMHSALPTVAELQPVTVVLVACTAPATVKQAYDAPWHFDLFSRPPPVVIL